jgi:hypothetical protein
MNPPWKWVPSFRAALLCTLNLSSVSHASAQPVELLNVTNTAWPALEIHQSSDVSGDLAFGSSERGAIPQAPAITTQPVGTNVVQGRPFTLSVVAAGLPAPSCQWFKDGLAIPESTNATCFVSSANPTPGTGHSGQYYVRATNPAGTVDSATVSVTVTPDTEGPILLYGALLLDGYIRLAWSEVMSNYFDPYNVFVYDPNGQGEFIGLHNPILQAGGTDFVLTPNTNLTIGIHYDVWIGVGSFKDQFGNAFREGQMEPIFPLLQELALLDYGPAWAHDFSGAELITNDLPFYLPGFDDSAWPAGPAPLGTEESGALPEDYTIATLVPPPPITTYYRLRFFKRDGASDLQFLRLAKVLYDDGFVAYLNGVEVGRARVPANQNATTLPPQVDNYRLTVRNVVDRSWTVNPVLPNPTILDLPTEILLADTAAFGPWTYNDTGADQGTAWREAGFEPGADWLSGWPLFYGYVGTPGLLELPQNTVLNLTNNVATPPA